MSDATIPLLIVAAVLATGALLEWQRRCRIYKAKHRRTLSDMYRPTPKVPSPPPEQK